MLAEERYKKILKILEQNNSVKSSYLIKLFNVSVETVRRDLEYLEKEGLLCRVHGGAVLDVINSKPVSLDVREKINNDEKMEIAKYATKFISEGCSVALDNGTTTFEIAKILKNRFKKLTIITNSIRIVNELCDVSDYTIILLGGILNNKDKSLIGTMVERNIEEFHIDVSFVSVSAISLKEGATDFDLTEVPIQRKFLERSRQKILLADSSKFGVVSLVKICDLDKIDYIVTDSKLKDAVYKKYLGKGIEIIKS